jgi:hypothetical protein
MEHYHNSKRARRIAAIVYLLFMAFIMTGTYLSEQNKATQSPVAADIKNEKN